MGGGWSLLYWRCGVRGFQWKSSSNKRGTERGVRNSYLGTHQSERGPREEGKANRVQHLRKGIMSSSELS